MSPSGAPVRTAERAISRSTPCSFPEEEIVSVLNVLETIYREQDPTLAFFDHAACRQAACGKCMVKVDGAVKLACKEPAHETMLLEPYSSRVVRDLLCQS